MKGDTRAASVIARRVAIVHMWQNGIPVRNISSRTGASVTTVYRWVRRWQEEGTVQTKAYRRKPRTNNWQREVIMTASTISNFTKNQDVKARTVSLAPKLPICLIPGENDIYLWLSEISKLIYVYQHSLVHSLREYIDSDCFSSKHISI